MNQIGRGSLVFSLFLIYTLLLNNYQAIATDITSSGGITLKTNDVVTEPYTPTDPTKPLQPTDPEDNGGSVTTNKGPLSLDVAPTKYDFGKQKMYQKTHIYSTVNNDEISSNGDAVTTQYLQVTDNRDADIYGWEVKVKQDTYLTSIEGYELQGTTINIPIGEARNALNEPPTQVDKNFTINEVTVTTEDKTIWASKNLGVGKSTSTYVWDSKDVSLTIPAKTAKAGSYKNNIVWTLTASAQN